MSEYDYEQGFEPTYPGEQPPADPAEQAYYDDPFQATVVTAVEAAKIGTHLAMSEYDARRAQAEHEQAVSSAEINGSWATKELQSRLGDFDKYKEMVAEEITANPDSYPEHEFTTPKGIMKQVEKAYYIAKGSHEAEAPSRRWAEIMASGNRSFRDIVGG